MQSRGLRVCLALLVCTVVGGLAGGLLSAYWWDFPPEDIERWGTETVILYSGIGAIGGFFIGGLLVSATLVVSAVRNRPSNWNNVPFWSTAAVAVLSFFTLGAGIVLVPVALVFSAMAIPRTRPPRPLIFKLGIVANACLGVVFVVVLILRI